MDNEDAWFKRHDIGEVGQKLVCSVPSDDEGNPRPIDANGCGEFYVRFEGMGNKHYLYVNEKKFIEWLKLTDEVFG